MIMNKSNKVASLITANLDRHVSRQGPKCQWSSSSLSINDEFNKALTCCSYSTSTTTTPTTSSVMAMRNSSSRTKSSSSSRQEQQQQEYGTKMVVQATPFPHDPCHPRLSPFLSHNIQHPSSSFVHDAVVSSSSSSKMHQNFTVTFLGTGAGGRANIKRAPSSTALRLSGCTFLFDAGEGTQRQLAMTKNLGVKDIVKIFVTHLHADHVAGLLGIILQKEMSVKHDIGSLTSSSGSGSGNHKHTLEIYGPKGIYDYIVMNVIMTCSRINHLQMVIYELVGGSDLRRGGGGHGGKQRHRMKPSSSSSSYQPTFDRRSATNNNIEQRIIAMGKDGTWTIQKLAVMKEDDVQGRDVHLRVGIKAAEVLHLPGIQTFGYVVEECAPCGRIDVEKAKGLGVAPGPKYRSLKNGYSVISDDGLRQVTPEQVMVDSNGDGMDKGKGKGKKRGRKFALLGDACKVPTPMMDLCRGADLLVYEATLEENSHAVTKQRGHSTATMAGRLAKQVKANILAMNHISGRHDSQESINELVTFAEKANCNTSDIFVAHDFLMVSIPEQYEEVL